MRNRRIKTKFRFWYVMEFFSIIICIVVVALPSSDLEHTQTYTKKKNSRIMNILRSLVIILLFVTKWWCWFVVGVHIFTDQKAFILKQRYLLLFLLIIEMHQTNIHNNSADYDGWLTAMWWRVCTKNVLHIAYCNMYRSIIKSGSCHIICMHTK